MGLFYYTQGKLWPYVGASLIYWLVNSSIVHLSGSKKGSTNRCKDKDSIHIPVDWSFRCYLHLVCLVPSHQQVFSHLYACTSIIMCRNTTGIILIHISIDQFNTHTTTLRLYKLHFISIQLAYISRIDKALLWLSIHFNRSFHRTVMNPQL